MPTYDYVCKKCKHQFEVFHGMTEKVVVICEKCKEFPCEKMISSFTVGGKKEIWDYDECRKVKPKWLKSRDGKTRVRYDPTKHGYGKGTG